MYKVSEKFEPRCGVPVDPSPSPSPSPLRCESDETTTFGHERLKVYHSAIQFVGEVSSLISQMPTGHFSLSQQLYRASISIPLNIAEGAGEFSRRDKARFYRMALRSATECAAILDVCRELGLAKPTAIKQGRQLLSQIVAMLTSMAKRFSGKGEGEGEEPS
jgi:four helix bundle protein